MGVFGNTFGGQQRSFLNQESYVDGEQFDNGKVIFQFDSGDQSIYTNGFPIFTSQNIKTTILNNNAGYFTDTQLLEMYNAGHDLQCYATANGTNQQIIDDIQLTISAYSRLSIPNPVHMAYMVGSFTDSGLKVVDNYIKLGRPVLIGYINRKSSKYELNSIVNTAGLSTLYSMIDYAKTNKLALIIYGHQVGIGGALSISTDDLNAMINYTKAAGCDIITTSQLYGLMYYLDIRLDRDCASDSINIIINNKYNGSVSIERSTDGNSWTEIHVLNPGVTDYTDTGLTANTNYYYRARGVKTTGGYYPYSRITTISTPLSMVLTSTGNGSGVSTLTLLPDRNMIVTLDGNGYFYTNSGGTTGQTQSITLVRGVSITTYIKVTSGISNLVFPSNMIREINTWTSSTNAASISFDISKLTNTSTISMLGLNSISGSVTPLKSLLKILSIQDQTTISGDLTGFKNFIQGVIGGTNTVTIDLTDMIQLQSYSNSSTGATTTGSINGLINCTRLVFAGTSPVSGEVNSMVKLQYIQSTSSIQNITFTRANNLKNICFFYIYPTIVLTSANINQLLADFWTNKDESKPLANRTLNIAGHSSSGAPTGQGIIDKSALQAYRSPTPPGTAALWTVTTR